MRRKISQRMLSASMAAVLAFGMVPMAPSAALAQDGIEGHWGQAALEEWMDYGVIKGYDDGRIAPDDFVNRAQMVAFLDRTMGYQETVENVYPDVADGTWYEDVVLRGAAAGVIKGDADTGMMRPEDSMTRQEAAAVIARVVGLDGSDSPDAGFKDQGEVDEWAEDAVNAMAEKGYVNGHDGYFRPDDLVTRAEAIAMLDNVFGDLCQEAGEYSSDVEGSLVISADGASLKDMVVKGDLIVAEGVGDGHVELDNVTVEGRLIVRGGGANSVVVKGASKIGQVIVDRAAGAVRIAVQGAAEVAGVVVSEAAEGVRLEGNVGSLTVEGAASVVEVAGSVDSVEVAETAADARVVILEGAEAETVKSDAKTATIVIEGTVASLAVSGNDSGITVSGTVGAIDVLGDDVVVKVEASATVEKVTTSASGTKVEGEGEVESVVAGEGSSDVTVSTEGTEVENNGSGDVAIEGGAVAPGESGTTPGGSTSGSGGSTVAPHVHSFVDGVCAADGAIDPTWAQVDSAADWNAAVEAGMNIVVVNDFETASQLGINKVLEVNGNGKTITAAASWTGSDNGNKHLLNITGGTESAGSAVSVKNLTLDSANKAFGAQAYCVKGVTVFENVTLKNSAGAGLTVNGSFVEAKSLNTIGNAWGGVNIDKGQEVVAETKFAFDEELSCSEVLPIYSDNGGIVVVMPDSGDGWAHIQNVGGKTDVWTRLFDGGSGIENNPYQISEGEQFENIAYLSSQMTGEDGRPYHFVQTEDIVVNGSGFDFNGTYDGGGNKIETLNETSVGYSNLFGDVWGSSIIEDITLMQSSGKALSLVSYAAGKSLTVDGVIIDGTSPSEVITVNSNNFGFIVGNPLYEGWGVKQAQTFKFSNITTTGNVVVQNKGTCIGMIVGSGPCFNYSDSSVEYSNCVNNGTIVGTTYAGLLFGNPAYMTEEEKETNKIVNSSVTSDEQFEVESCENKGLILAVGQGGNAGMCPSTSTKNTVLENKGYYVTGENYKVESCLNDVTFAAYSQDDSSFLLSGSQAPRGYEYELVFSVSEIVWTKDGAQSNGLKILSGVGLSDSADFDDESKITSSDCHAYDIDTAISKNVIVSEEGLRSNASGAYSPYLIVKDGKVNIVFLDSKELGFTSDSSVSMMVYAYDSQGLLKGAKTL